MRVLHLFEAADLSLPHARLALLAQSVDRIADAQQDVCLLGNQNLEAAAVELGISPRWRFNLAGRLAISGYFRLRRVLRHEQYDLIHCWSIRRPGSATLATVAAPGIPRVVTVTRLPSASEARWASHMASDRRAPTTYLPVSATISRELLAGGVSPSRVHVLRPGIDMGLIHPAIRKQLRQKWQVDDATVVVSILSDPPEATHGVRAFMAIGLADQILSIRGKPVKLLLHPNQLHLPQARHIASQINCHDRIIIEPDIDRPWTVLPGCDIAMAMGPAGGNLPLLWAMACGVPIAAEATPAISEIVEDRHSALLARPDLPKALSHRITQLAMDAQLAWKLRDTARHEAYSFFSRQRHVQSLRQVYQQVLAGQEVHVPDMEPTGGLRFAGRA